MLRTETPCQLQTPIKSIEFFYWGNMKEIQLTQGQVALVDDEDFERVSQYKWHASPQPNYAKPKTFYARAFVGGKSMSLHQFVLGKLPRMVIDHVNGNTLDCTRANLRHASFSENRRNSSQSVKNKSGLRGVSWSSKRGMWRADICTHRARVCLGHFIDKLEAAKAYNEAAKKYHGEFATLNPIEGEE